MNRVPLALMLVLAASLAASLGCARTPDDARISKDVQSKFSQDSGLSAKQLTVQASHGVVTLGGVVDNEAQREAASRQAATVEGVKQVLNNLQVGGGAQVTSIPAPAAQSETTKPARRTPMVKARETATDSASLHDAPREADVAGPAAGDAIAENSPPPASSPQDPPPSNLPPPAAAPAQPQRVTIEQGTPITVRLIDGIDSEKNQVGDPFHATLNAALSAEGAEAIPAGTDVTGHVVELRSAGKFKGQSLVVLQLDSITANGKSYALQTDQYRKEGASRGKNTAEKVGGGAVIGGIIGAIAGGGKGAAIGSAAGAGVGGGVQAASKSEPIKLPSETVLNFTLQAPVTVLRPADPNSARQKLGDSQ